jgi:hypothetical protein
MVPSVRLVKAAKAWTANKIKKAIRRNFSPNLI